MLLAVDHGFQECIPGLKTGLGSFGSNKIYDRLWMLVAVLNRGRSFRTEMAFFRELKLLLFGTWPVFESAMGLLNHVL